MMKKTVIICVDDESVVLVSLRDQLRNHLGQTYDIEIAESGEEAIELFSELLEDNVEIPLVISDQIMPGLKGDELLIQLHQGYPKTLKILLTGQADAEVVGNAVNNANLYRYISKPWDEPDLCLTVTEALRSYTQDKQLIGQNKQLQILYDKAQQEIVERKRFEVLLAEANQTLEHKVDERTQELSQAIENLKATQNQLIAQEKMASLGTLTAGIAHEIKNPLNFVNNFAQLSIGLADELIELLTEQKPIVNSEDWVYIHEILTDLKLNAASINEEGQRADSIVRNMLLHSGGTVGQFQKTDLNILLDETIQLTYHSIRAKDVTFNINLETYFDSTIEPISVIIQDISRAFLNMINNACYAAHHKKISQPTNIVPIVRVTTKKLPDFIEIRVWDNGSGLPSEVQDKLFTPFFTTKPAGEGTGLGLSITYDIIVQVHQGKIDVNTELGEFTEFIISLPKQKLGNE
ncbi:ATP-binding protein [Anaerolineales bacterium HSG24]|nr:ATP-binding protein [Anaerolineales bacterium HSG24]